MLGNLEKSEACSRNDGGIGGMLGRSWGYSGGNWGTHAFCRADGNGNITCMISNQTVVASYRYDPYGRSLYSSGSLAGANVYRFSSKPLHANSGLYYYAYRFYDTELQRWLNRDPLDEPGFELMRNARPWERTLGSDIPAELSQGPNLYTYMLNDSLNDIDPYGLWSFYRWLYTGDGNSSDEVYDEALDNAAGYVNCYLDCLKNDNKCAAAWVGSLGAAGIGYGGTPYPIAKAIAGRGPASTAGKYLKSGVRAVGIRLTRWGFPRAGQLFLDAAKAFRRASGLGRAARIGVAAAAIAETGFAIHCAIKCAHQQQ